MASLLTPVAITLTLATAVPVEAHPYGYPQTVTIAADADRHEVVRLTWKVGGVDELTLLGVKLGLLPQERVMLDGAISVQASDPTVLGPSEQFASYLLKQMTVSSGGHACAGAVEPPSDLVGSGVDVDYRCPGSVGAARIEIRMLSDLDPAYQTVATGPQGQRQVYGPGRYAHDWALGDAPVAGDPGHDRSIAPRIATAVVGVLLVVAAVLLLRRRARRRRVVPTRTSS
ncbi:hypothetical protein JNW91_10460 [Micromonospora sp. STR1_7]|uniref:Uncharacterized protein n=1 Tax=Micromonospora parastrephiae TaxID=2806101 RepID=A0ABS1XSK5_9ACTN|nr:hypothetical protein [Micromonospora parastrephiae]MBM0232245.1 hypothetical protein [Micromonospora parastrephiae]